MNAAMLPDISGLVMAARAAAQVSFNFPASRSIAGGLRPVAACLDRLLWFQRDRLSQLLAGVSNKAEMDHYEAAVRENPARIEATRRDLLGAITYELQAHGCVLLPKVRIQ